MSESVEYTDWHLTPDGWKRGTTRTDNGVVEDVAIPSGCVATYRCTEEYSSPASRPNRFSAITWQSPEHEELSKLLDVYGDCPRLSLTENHNIRR